MALPILNDLKNELERLYIAGSGLAKDDPRIKKYIPNLMKLGERAPVFKTLADRLSALTQQEASTDNLMEAGAMLFSLIYSQSRNDNGMEVNPIEYQKLPLYISQIRFSELNDIFESIKPRAFYCYEKLEELYTNGRYQDPRLYKSYVMIVKLGNENAADITGRLIIPSLNDSIIPIIESELDIKGGSGDARLFKALYVKLGNNILPLSERVLAEGSADVLAAALYTLKGNEKYTEVLKKYAKDRRKIIKEAAESALSV